MLPSHAHTSDYEHDRKELTYLVFQFGHAADDPRSESFAEACLHSQARKATIAGKRRRRGTWLISRRPPCTRPAPSITRVRGLHAVAAGQNVVSGDRGAGAILAWWTRMPLPRHASTRTEFVLRVRRSERARAAGQRTRWALPSLSSGPPRWRHRSRMCYRRVFMRSCVCGDTARQFFC